MLKFLHLMVSAIVMECQQLASLNLAIKGSG